MTNLPNPQALSIRVKCFRPEIHAILHTTLGEPHCSQKQVAKVHLYQLNKHMSYIEIMVLDCCMKENWSVMLLLRMSSIRDMLLTRQTSLDDL